MHELQLVARPAGHLRVSMSDVAKSICDIWSTTMFTQRLNVLSHVQYVYMHERIDFPFTTLLS